MAITAAAITGAVVGLRHSLEADHLAAISTLVDDRKTDRPGVVGASWGVGHSLPIIAVGLLFVFLSASLPETVTLAFEVLAGLILVYLGLRMLLEVAGLLTVERHEHDGHEHTHVSLGSVSIGSFHTHVDGESFLVGIVHGLAGSGAIVVALAASASTVSSSFSLLLSFSVITVLTMSVLSYLWGSVLTTRLQSGLKVVAGSASFGIGGLLVANELLGIGPILF
ncbi:high-affinity nickel-transporter protein [Halorientalis sp. IM1011]|uniref:sulfite exporter TauE/SafE family protein n=1 Tax=Halorientalis sp. IM1011 TaxID=1932360 RepID=UPI00097CCF4B|nr:sulfite exporter TauE/SafE family protein [Halorientalis sp. IM1011]AQL43758.1 high-affinity nickel-transporter protein [Halorientalis sp. IM1011]